MLLQQIRDLLVLHPDDPVLHLVLHQLMDLSCDKDLVHQLNLELHPDVV
jgi:hypothetical protein